MKWLDNCLLTLAVIGCIVWGLIGFFNFNLVSFLFGSMSWISRIIYAIVGLCGLYLLKRNLADACHICAGRTQRIISDQFLWKNPFLSGRLDTKKMGVFSIRSTPIFRKPGSFRAKPLLSPVHIPADPLCF